MTENTSSASAKGTPSVEPEPGLNGTPATVPPSATTSLMQTKLDDLLAQYHGRARMDNIHFALWNARATVVHWLGVHTMIPTEEWDFDREFVAFVGRTCWKCGLRE